MHFFTLFWRKKTLDTVKLQDFKTIYNLEVEGFLFYIDTYIYEFRCAEIVTIFEKLIHFDYFGRVI